MDPTVGLYRRTRTLIAIGYVVAVILVYSWHGWPRQFEVTWIPIIEYGPVGVIAGLVWIGLKIADAIRSRPGSGSSLESPTVNHHTA
jgi:hypothetical protein